MPSPLVALTLEQFTQLLHAAALRRRITEVHLHHTWRPRRQDFRGAATIEAIRRYHREQMRWQDIAQHLTIDPYGGLWPGRNWNLPPASQRGHNGTALEGPFMIEMIGDFDTGQDPFDGVQHDAAVSVVALLLHKFDLSRENVRFHRQLGSPKTCPGTGIDAEVLGGEIEAAHRKLAASKARRARSKGGGEPTPDQLLGAELIETPMAPVEAVDAEVPELGTAGRWINQAAAEAVADRQRDWRRMRALALGTRAVDPWAGLKPYVVNLALGQLSEEGQFRTTPADLEGIIDGLSEYCHEVEQPRLMLHAHGGLVAEGSALEYAAKVAPWWRDKGIYPVYFVWESGLLDILGQYVLGRRDLADWTSDPALEALLRVPGTLGWSGMKKSARLASSADSGDGHPGGARLFVDLLDAANRAGEFPKLEVHAVGHSAGSIFHAHLLPILTERNFPIQSLHFLAPAITVALFRERLVSLVANGNIRRLHQFTMDDRAERADDCMKVYRKSLLYLVSRAFEPPGNRAILGLDRSLRANPDLAELFGLDGAAGGQPRAELQFSSLDDDRPANPLTAALRHGDFDNDPATMSSVLRRVLGVEDNTQFGRYDFPYAILPRSLADLPPPGGQSPLAATDAGASDRPASAPDGRGRRALCVGINQYPSAPLSGCVADARAWGGELERLGFSVQYLLDGRATRAALLDALNGMLARASAGDVLVFQYSGHGTQMPDEDGDEADRLDEAFVPVDYVSGRLLLDDDLAEVLAGVPPGVQFTLFMDCCHSGTNSRFAPLYGARTSGQERVRWLPPTPELVRAHQAFRRTIGEPPRGIKELSAPRVAHLAACQDQEFAWETGSSGDFTSAATRLLGAAAARGDTNEAFMAAIRAEVALRGRQHPMMMTPAPDMIGRPLLGPLVVDGKT